MCKGVRRWAPQGGNAQRACAPPQRKCAEPRLEAGRAQHDAGELGWLWCRGGQEACCFEGSLKEEGRPASLTRDRRKVSRSSALVNVFLHAIDAALRDVEELQVVVDVVGRRRRVALGHGWQLRQRAAQ